LVSISKIIIGIHGLRNKPEEELLSDWWKRSILDGLNLNGCPVKDLKFELVYWADCIYPESLSITEKNRMSPLFLGSPYLPFSG